MKNIPSSSGYRNIIYKTDSIYQIHADDANGLPAFYFLEVDSIRQKALEKAIKLGHFDLTAYGTILHSGYGVPGEDDKRLMKERYHYDVRDN